MVSDPKKIIIGVSLGQSSYITEITHIKIVLYVYITKISTSYRPDVMSDFFFESDTYCTTAAVHTTSVIAEKTSVLGLQFMLPFVKRCSKNSSTSNY